MSLIRFLVILLVFIGLNGYIYIRGRQALPEGLAVHLIYTIVFLVCSLSIFIAIFAGSRLPVWLSLIFEQAGGYYIILFIFLLAAVLLADLLRLTNYFFQVFPLWLTSNYPQAKLVYLSMVLLFMIILSLIGFYRFSHPEIVTLDLSSASHNETGNELTVMVISDLHLGNVIRRGRLVKWVDQINSQKPDIILIAGDIFDHSFRAVESQQMDKELVRMKATFGVYAIPGNHDYYTGIDNAMSYLKKAGIRILRDTVVTIANRIVLIGRDDLTNKNRKDLALLVDGLNPELLRIVVDHQPLSFEESLQNNIYLHVSGHTHNGQIFPYNHMVSRIYKHGYGYMKSRDTHFYVSSGVGLWGAPIRLGTQSEMVKIQL